jgi:tetratricopeptide (TPR) repeat protein
MMAGDLLRQAIALEPEYAAGHAWYAYWLHFLVGHNWSDDAAAARAEAAHHAERAITLDAQDARGFTIAGHIRAVLNHRLREALALHDRALALNPNLAMAWALSALTYIYLGEWNEGEERLNRYKRLSPMDPGAFHYDVGFCLIALMRRDYEAAVSAGRTVSELNPAFPNASKPYLSALGHLGQISEAAVILRRLLLLDPDFSVQSFLATTPLERAEDREHFAEGLRLAGVAEG